MPTVVKTIDEMTTTISLVPSQDERCFDFKLIVRSIDLGPQAD